MERIMGGRTHMPIPVGTKFGRLTILDYPTRLMGRGNYQYFCKCACGSTNWFYAHKMRSGHTSSCGCYRADSLGQRNKQRSEHAKNTAHKS